MATYTLAEIEENLSDYADYEQQSSVSRAELFITWANRWLIQQPQHQSDTGQALTMNPVQVQSLLASAQRYVSENAIPTSNYSARVRHFSFENFRS